jgi:hypothetical protein
VEGEFACCWRGGCYCCYGVLSRHLLNDRAEATIATHVLREAVTHDAYIDLGHAGCDADGIFRDFR